MAAHAKLSPSSAHEWMNCPLSITMKELYEHLDPHRYSVANAQGTIKHHVIERCLNENLDPYHFVDTEFRLGDLREEDDAMPQEWQDYTYEFTEDDADTMMIALDEIDSYPGERFIEYRVDTSKYCGPNQFGTLDLAVIIPVRKGVVDLLIWDNKFGRVAVNPFENMQMSLYGLCFWENIVSKMDVRVRRVIIRVWQPLVVGAGGRWVTTLDYLEDFGEKVKKAAKKALGENPKANPGPVQCEYCIGAKTGKCEANYKWNRDVLIAAFAEGEEIDDLIENDEVPCFKFNGVSPKERTWLIDNFPMFKRFIERLENQAFRDAYYGTDVVPGKKLIYGNRPRRKYRNAVRAEGRIVASIGEERAYTKKLISPAQLEKEVGKTKIGDYEDIIERGEAKLVLVDEHDSRPRVKSIREMFEEGDD